MTTMLDKMARAIHEDRRLGRDDLYEDLFDHQKDSWKETARAALQAIRDAAQTDEGHKLLNDALDWDRNADQDMTAMIDAILAEATNP